MSEAQAMVGQHDINYWAALVAAVAYWVIGAVWYAKPLFGNAWMQAIGKSEEQVQAEFKPLQLVWVFITAWFASYGIARIDLWHPGTSLLDTILVAILVWFCFTVTTVVMHDVMEKRPARLTMINALYQLVGFVAMGVIIGLWR